MEILCLRSLRHERGIPREAKGSEPAAGWRNLLARPRQPLCWCSFCSVAGSPLTRCSSPRFEQKHTPPAAVGLLRRRAELHIGLEKKNQNRGSRWNSVTSLGGNDDDGHDDEDIDDDDGDDDDNNDDDDEMRLERARRTDLPRLNRWLCSVGGCGFNLI